MYYIYAFGVINQLNQSYNSSHHELNSTRRGVTKDLYCICLVPAKSPWLMYVWVAATVGRGTRIRGRTAAAAAHNTNILRRGLAISAFFCSARLMPTSAVACIHIITPLHCDIVNIFWEIM